MSYPNHDSNWGLNDQTSFTTQVKKSKQIRNKKNSFLRLLPKVDSKWDHDKASKMDLNYARLKLGENEKKIKEKFL